MVAAVSGNAGAGGVMLALGADRVLLRDGVVLNPHYQTMGLYGSEYWTYVAPPPQSDDRQPDDLTGRCLPVGASQAVSIGLADAVLPGCRAEFDDAVMDYAARLARDSKRLLAAKHASRRHRRTTTSHCSPTAIEELAEMSRDIFDDRNGFAAARHAFVHHQPAPLRLEGSPSSRASRAS